MIVDKKLLEDLVDESINEIKKIDINYNKQKILYASKSTSIDRRFHFLEEIRDNMLNTDIIVMLPSKAVELLAKKYDFSYISEPAIFSKNFLAGNEIVVTVELKNIIEEEKIFQDEFYNLKRYMGIDEQAAILLVVFAIKFIRNLLMLIRPELILLWNEFTGINSIIKKISEEMIIPLSYIEFGVLPGTYAIDSLGEMGESFPSIYPERFLRLEINDNDLEKACQLREYFYTTGINRNKQPKVGIMERIKKKIDFNHPIILFAGQFDLDSGFYPYTEKTKKYHSPIFTSSDEAAIELSKLAGKHNWNFIYKPHPLMKDYRMKEDRFPLNVILAEDVNINEIIDFSDLVITILSQSAYVSVIRKKPTLMLGYNQISGKGCLYEAYDEKDVEVQIVNALNYGFTKEQDENFIKHIAQLSKYYLYDDLSVKPFLYGKGIKEGAAYLQTRMEVQSNNSWVEWQNEDEIVIWGLGIKAKEYIENRFDYSRVEAIVENDQEKQGDTFWGIDVMSPDILKEKNKKIVICSSKWNEISNQLVEMNFCAFKDFIPDWVLKVKNQVDYRDLAIIEQIRFLKKKRKLMAFFGNCQITRIIMYFKKNESFFKDYFILRLPLIQNINVWEKALGPNESIIKEIDVFITQYITEDNKFSYKWSTKAIKKLLNSSCQVIIIPNMFFNGYYPQAGHWQNPDRRIKYDPYTFPWGDKFIDRLYAEGMTVKNIVNCLTDTEFMTEEAVIGKAENSFRELERREKEYCDIMISDYIRENYQEILLFYSERHPTDLLTRELVKRIWAKLGEVKGVLEFPEPDDFGNNSLVIYPSVKKYLKLNFSKDYFYVSKPYYYNPLTIEEYIHAYINHIWQNQKVQEKQLAQRQYDMEEGIFE